MLKNFIRLPYVIYVTILFVVVILISFPITLILMLFPNRIKDHGMFILLKAISNLWFILIGFIAKNYHRSQIDFSKSYIIMANHQSFLDAAIVYTSIPQVFKSLGKKELEKAPVYGIIYRSVVITVDRSSMTARAASLRKMKKELEEGNSMLIFPEGTFKDTAQTELLPFQSGGFSLALMQEVDILPVLFLDTPDRIHPSKLWVISPGFNRAVFLPSISHLAFDKKAGDQLKDFTQAYMQDCLDFCRKHSPKDVWEFATHWQATHLQT
ncbi:MAG: 1-acyl-sn-glycerol-3-phosphate acyltransferase [Chitinophagaceae bacterium]|nr:1-acyl-sn-glycerol-3-phosphate acyltransferase [Chitinophagaceae bacterium]